MITGIQITKAANDDLLNSFWLLDSEKGEARCIVAKAGYAEDEVVAVSKLGDIEYREVPVEVKPEVRVEGGQHLNVNVLRRETLEDAVVLLAPFAPHIGEELWSQLGGTDSVFHSQWPECDTEAMKDDEVEVAVQVNGKTRAVISVPADISKEDAIVQGKEAVKDKMAGNIVKEIYVPGKIINIVCK